MEKQDLVCFSNFNVNSNQENTYNKSKKLDRAKVVMFVCAGLTAVEPISSNIDVALSQKLGVQSYMKYDLLENKSNDSWGSMSKVVDIMKCMNLNKIEFMKAFTEDWNGNGAKAFSVKAIQLFEEIINSLVKQPEIAPTGRNSLLMQYELDDKSILAFEVRENVTEKVFVPQGNYTMIETETFTDDFVQNISASVEKFYGFK